MEFLFDGINVLDQTLARFSPTREVEVQMSSWKHIYSLEHKHYHRYDPFGGRWCNKGWKTLQRNSLNNILSPTLQENCTNIINNGLSILIGCLH